MGRHIHGQTSALIRLCVGGLRRAMAKSRDRRQRYRRQRNSLSERNGQRPQRGGEKSERGTRDLGKGQRHTREVELER